MVFQGPIESKVIPFDKPEVQNITKSLEGHYTDYNFGISAVAETHKGLFISSGIIWYKDCVYLREGSEYNRNVRILYHFKIKYEVNPLTF